jgi:hypothetical protein
LPEALDRRLLPVDDLLSRAVRLADLQNELTPD